jgi:hypothetical protein
MKTEENGLTLERLERRLEKQGRSLKLTAALLGLTIGVLVTHWILGDMGLLNLQAKTVTVSDDSATYYRARINSSGLHALHVADRKEASFNNQAYLEVGSGGNRSTHLVLQEHSYDGSWGGGLQLYVFAPGRRSGLLIRDFEGKERVRLTVSEAGPKLELLDEDGQVLFQAP